MTYALFGWVYGLLILVYFLPCKAVVRIVHNFLHHPTGYRTQRLLAHFPLRQTTALPVASVPVDRFGPRVIGPMNVGPSRQFFQVALPLSAFIHVHWSNHASIHT